MTRPVCLLVALYGLAAVALPSPASDPGVFYADFRGQPIDERLFERDGSEDQVRTDAGGLHVTVVGNSPNQRGEKGLRLRFKVYGDFEITTSYELLSAPYGSGPTLGVSIYVRSNSSIGTAMMLGRFNGRDRGYYSASKTVTGTDGKRHNNGHDRTTTATAGKLKLIRRGSELTCLAADAGNDGFQEIDRLPDFGPEELVFLRIAALKNGTSQSLLDARFHDLEIRSGDAVTPNGSGGQTSTAGSWNKSGGWLVAAEVMGLVSLVVLLGLWRRRHNASSAAERVSEPEVDRDPERRRRT